MRKELEHALGGLTDREAPERHAVHRQRRDVLEVGEAQILVHRPLNDAEAGLARRGLDGEAASRPGGRPPHGALGPASRRLGRWALVEHHGDVRAEQGLHPHRLLGRQAQERPVEVGAEENWFVGSMEPVRVGIGTEVRRNRFDTPRISWIGGSYGGVSHSGGTASNPIIIEDNDVFDVNLTEEGGGSGVYGDPQWHGGMKLLNVQHVIIRRNYIRNVHGPAIWFDWGNDFIEVYDNITVDCGIHSDGGDMPHIFLEASPAHGGMVVRNNWVLGYGARIGQNDCHGGGDGTRIYYYQNTIDGDAGSRIGMTMKDGQRNGGDSTNSHPDINTVGMGPGDHFSDWFRAGGNVVRKRNTAIGNSIPVAGMQAGGTPDHERNYEWLGNKYEIHSGVSSPFRWDGGFIDWATWQAKRAAQDNAQNTGPYFDAAGSFVTWSGTEQFADTPCNWEGN